jgi:hypothetical protein
VQKEIPAFIYYCEEENLKKKKNVLPSTCSLKMLTHRSDWAIGKFRKIFKNGHGFGWAVRGRLLMIADTL